MSVEREIVVVGGGPAGLSAALAAARAGARVTLLDAYARPGGQYYRQPPERLRAESSHRQREGRALWEQAAAAGVEICAQTTVWDIDGERTLSAAGPRGIEPISARAVILAAGTCERVAAFPGWTLPGVITTGAAQTLLYQHVRPGRRVLVAGTGPLQLVTAAELLHAGVEVAAVLEGNKILTKSLPRAFQAWGQWQRAREGLASLWALARRAVPYHTGWGILAAHGSRQVEGATIARLDAQWRPIAGSEQEIDCDAICIGYGFQPLTTLARLAGAAHEWRADLGGEVPIRDEKMETSVPGIFAAGDGAGIGGYRLALLEGQIAGSAAAALSVTGGVQNQETLRALGRARRLLKRERGFQKFYAHLFTPGPGLYERTPEETVACRCEGVTFGHLNEAIQNGARTLVELKALTRCGMGECQGRICGAVIPPWLARATGQSPAAVGSYPARPPAFPIPLSAFSNEEK